MKLELIEKIEPAEWDKLIINYETRMLFHRSAWLNFLENTQPGKIIRLKIIQNGKIEGYFVGLMVKKGPIKVLGSPLPGWTTNYMGPIVNKNFNWEYFLKSLDEICQSWGIDHLEMISPFANPDLMTSMGFRFSKGKTYIVSLSKNEEEMWYKLKKKSCRYPIKKAIREGLRVVENKNLEFIVEYYDELKEVFLNQHLIPSYPIERLKRLFDNLKKDFLLALQVKFGDKVIASGIFPYDEKCIYFFGGASRIEFHGHCPNEILHWTAMKYAADLGIPKYDMGGAGSFKPKFGGLETPIYRFYKSYSLQAKLGREFYRILFLSKQRIKGSILSIYKKAKMQN